MEPNCGGLLITSVQNPKVKQVIDLREKNEREKTGLFLIEGYRELLRAVDSGQSIQTLFICPELFLGSNEWSLIDKVKKDCSLVIHCSEKVFRKISYRDRPDGLLAIAPQKKLALDDLNKSWRKSPNPLFIVAEAIEKPGNLGTILRSADGVGADGLIVCDKCTDIHNPNVVRASVGTLFTIPVVEVSGEEALVWLQSKGVRTVAATPHAQLEYTQVDLSGPIAIAVGTEQLGLSEKWMGLADLQVRIPMLGVADSLNVAMATTLLLYEALRQRRQR